MNPIRLQTHYAVGVKLFLFPSMRTIITLFLPNPLKNSGKPQVTFKRHMYFRFLLQAVYSTDALRYSIEITIKYKYSRQESAN